MWKILFFFQPICTYLVYTYILLIFHKIRKDNGRYFKCPFLFNNRHFHRFFLYFLFASFFIFSEVCVCVVYTVEMCVFQFNLERLCTIALSCECTYVEEYYAKSNALFISK